MAQLLPPPQKGSLLVAEPLLGDPNFDRSVILLTEHNENGSVGFVLNKPLDYRLEDLVIGFPPLETTVHHGGPVQEDSLFFVHSKGDELAGSEPIAAGLWWGGELEALKTMINLGTISSNDIRFFLGYSGWSPGQLEAEMRQKSWLVRPATGLDILQDRPAEMYRDILMGAGGKYPLWANTPADPSLN